MKILDNTSKEIDGLLRVSSEILPQRLSQVKRANSHALIIITRELNSRGIELPDAKPLQPSQSPQEPSAQVQTNSEGLITDPNPNDDLTRELTPAESEQTLSSAPIDQHSGLDPAAIMRDIGTIYDENEYDKAA